MDRLKVFKILIVDDSALFRQTLKEMLQVRFPSIEIHEATDGEKARQKIKTSPPDLIFMDINLPGENGLLLTQKIKVRYPNIIISLLTGWNLPEYREASIQCKADYFLFKGSVTEEEIFALVGSVLSHWKETPGDEWIIRFPNHLPKSISACHRLAASYREFFQELL